MWAGFTFQAQVQLDALHLHYCNIHINKRKKKSLYILIQKEIKLYQIVLGYQAFEYHH